MSTSIPFHEETFRPISIKGNADAERPVEFDINAVGGSSRARLKSIIIATDGLAQSEDWTPSTQDAVIKAFETGAPVFREGVSAIRNLSAPAALFLKAGLLRELPPGVTRTAQMPVTSGAEFSALCGFMPLLAFEVAMAIAKSSAQVDVDPLFFQQLGILVPAGTPDTQAGNAAAASPTSGSGATAGSKTRTAGRRRTTSRTPSSRRALAP